MENIEVKAIIPGRVSDIRETVATFKSDELQKAISYVQEAGDPYMYEFYQYDGEGSLIFINAEEVIYDRDRGMVHHDLSAY